MNWACGKNVSLKWVLTTVLQYTLLSLFLEFFSYLVTMIWLDIHTTRRKYPSCLTLFPLNSKFICPNIVSISNFKFNKKFFLFTLINCDNFLFKYRIVHCSNITSTFRAFTWIFLARFALLSASLAFAFLWTTENVVFIE